MKNKDHKLPLIVLINLLLIIIGILLSVSLGATKVDLYTVWKSIFQYQPILEMQLVRDIRLPRAIAAIFAGGMLGVSGALMQGVTRNPLAEPSLLGISQGATLAVAVLYANQTVAGLISNMGAAFVGALLSGLLIIAFTLRNPGNLSMGKLLLAGTALSTFFLSLSSVIALLTNQSQMLGFWVAGGFRNVNWMGTMLLSVVGTISIIVAIFLAPKINIINLGDDIATSFGIDPIRVRLLTLLLIIPMCASVVAVAKNISFVGLIIPQIVGRLFGQNYQRIIPFSFVFGATLLLFSDIIARIINSPYETPIGIFTSLIGIPFFILIVRKEKA